MRRRASRSGTAALGALLLVGVVAPPAQAATAPPVPLTSGVGSEPWYASLLGASGGFAVLTRSHPTNLSLPSRGGPVSAVDISTGASHDLTLPPGSSPEVSEGHALLGDGSGGWTVEDLATGATSSLPPVNGTEHGGDSGLWRLEQPFGEPVQHLLVRDVVTGDSTDHGPLPSSLNPNMAVVRDAAGNLVVVDRYSKLFDVVTGTTWTEHALPAGILDCPSLTTDALGCFTSGAVLRVPLDGSAPVTVATPSTPVAVAVTPEATAWVLVDGALRTQPAAGGAVTRATQDVSIVYDTKPLASYGSQLLFLSPGDLSQAGLYAVPDAAAAPSQLALVGAAPLVSDDLQVGGGRVVWRDTTSPKYRSRVARPTGAGLGLGSTSEALVAGALREMSGRHSLGATGVTGDATGLQDYWYDGQLLVARGRQAALSGDRLVYERADHRLVVHDIATAAETVLPVLGQLVFDLSGDRLAYTRADNSVWVRSLSSGVTAQVAPEYSTMGGVQVLGSHVAWQTACCSSSPDTWSWVDTATPGSVVESGSLLALSNDGAVVTDDYAGTTGSIGIRPYGSSDVQQVASNAVVVVGYGGLHSPYGVDAGVAAWIDGSTLQPQARATGLDGGRPFALSPVEAQRIPGYAGWSLSLKTSAPLTSCSVALTGGGQSRSFGCDELGMDAGEVSVLGSFDGLPVGAYTWTLTAGNASGAVLDTAGAAWTATGTAYVPSDTTLTTPAKDTTVLAGKVATFTAAATGVPAPTVQWYRQGADFSLTPVAGATSTTLHVTATTALDGARYAAVFDNGAGGAQTSAVLHVLWPPRVLTSPKSLTVRAGTTASFSATATARPAAKVQWQVSKDGGRTFAYIGWATATTFKVGATATRSGWRFRAVFSNAYGKAVSAQAVLRVT